MTTAVSATSQPVVVVSPAERGTNNQSGIEKGLDSEGSVAFGKTEIGDVDPTVSTTAVSYERKLHVMAEQVVDMASSQKILQDTAVRQGRIQ